jgi:hypothetical protein
MERVEQDLRKSPSGAAPSPSSCSSSSTAPREEAVTGRGGRRRAVEELPFREGVAVGSGRSRWRGAAALAVLHRVIAVEEEEGATSWRRRRRRRRRERGAQRRGGELEEEGVSWGGGAGGGG